MTKLPYLASNNAKIALPIESYIAEERSTAEKPPKPVRKACFVTKPGQ
jgi:hypothetical protein